MQPSVSCFRCLLAYSPLPLPLLIITLLRTCTYVPTQYTYVFHNAMSTLCLRTLLLHTKNNQELLHTYPTYQPKYVRTHPP